MFHLFKLSETTKKGFLILVAFFAIILLIFGFIYWLIAKHMQKNAKKIDGYMVDLCRYRIVTNPKQFVEAVKYYEQRNLYRAIKWPLRIFILTLILLLCYCLFSTPGTTKKIFTSFFDLFPRLKWQTDGSINKELEAAGQPLIVGISWMPVSFIPNVTFKKIDATDINLYLSTLFYLVTIVLFFNISGHALSYYARIRRGMAKSKTVFEKNLDQFNYHSLDTPMTSMPIQSTPPIQTNFDHEKNEQ